MPTEIERKFLVKNDSWKTKADAGVPIKQGYLSTSKERNVRVRQKGEKAFLTVKGKTEGISRLEFEYEIPQSEAQEIIAQLCQGPTIDKFSCCQNRSGRAEVVCQVVLERYLCCGFQLSLTVAVCSTTGGYALSARYPPQKAHVETALEPLGKLALTRVPTGIVLQALAKRSPLSTAPALSVKQYLALSSRQNDVLGCTLLTGQHVWHTGLL